MKTVSSIVFAAAAFLLNSTPLVAYERLQGSTEVIYWDKTQAYPGYTLFGVRSNTYLIDLEGQVVHRWPVGTNPRLLDSGNLLDAAGGEVNGFTGLRELDWEGNLVWQHTESRTGYAPHHDFLRIYNPKMATNTTLYIAAKSISPEACLAAGCNPASGSYTNVQVDAIVEVDMTGKVIWEWCFFDHGIQDVDATKANYVGAGKSIADYPGRLNLNLPGRPLNNNWLHCNSIDYNQSLDQIVINAAGGEFYVIDHSNTFLAGGPEASMALAAGPKGDFLYRFGDPARYAQGNPPSIQQNWASSTTGNTQIGGSSHAQWIRAGLPGAGHFLVFNNGGDFFETTPQSYIFEINGYLNSSTNDIGTYVNPPTAGYNNWSAPGHDTDKRTKSISRQITWMYYSMANQGMFSHLDSGAQRLPNGNTLICDSSEGHIFEVTASGEAVWEYINPASADGILTYKRDSWPVLNFVFRAYRYSTNHPALVGRALSPQGTITGQLPSYLSAPTISGTAQSPTAPAATNQVWVTALITNARGVASATLTFVTGDRTNALAMLDDGQHGDGAAGDGVYGGLIPAAPAGTTVKYYVSAQDEFGLTAAEPSKAAVSTYAYTVQGANANSGPAITEVTATPVLPTQADSVWVTARASSAVPISTLTLTYLTGTSSSSGGGPGQTNVVFLETMRGSAVKPWTGDGCSNAWTVTFTGNNPFEQRDGANYGTGNTNGMEFKGGTTNLLDSMVAPTQALDTRGASGFVEFWLWADGLSGSAGWAFQVDSGNAYQTRLSELTGQSHNWQLYHYDLQTSELISGLKLRWQFRGGQDSVRMDLDQITVKVVATGGGNESTTVAMLDDGAHQDGAVGDEVYGAAISVQPAGTTVSYYLTATDSTGRSITSPTSAHSNAFTYTVNATSSPSWSMLNLPDTGQTQSYTETFGEDSDYTIHAPLLTDKGDGTVTDNITGLMWQKGDSGELTWESALTYAQTNRIGSYSDWRLPTAHELFSILNHGKTNPALDTNFFTLTAARSWWTSDVQPIETNRVWAANAGGGIGPHPETETLSAGGAKRFHARCVRGAPRPTGSPIHRFTANGDGTVADLDTGLIWQQAEVTNALSWEGAMQYANTLSLAGQTGWRLPDIKELQSLNDETLTSPSVDTNSFPGARPLRYWSSTTEINGINRAWFVDFQWGIVSYDSKLTNLLVRCVRGGLTNAVSPTNGFTPQFATIPAGQFQMGDHFGFVDPAHPSDEIPVHNVYVDAFEMATTLLTCQEYVQFLNSALTQGLVEIRSDYVYGAGHTNVYCDTYGSDTNSRVQWSGGAFTVRDNRELHPITGVRWFGAIAYCNWASLRDGYSPCYDLATGACDLSKSGYRLPTEAEWEYAARGGLYNPYGLFPWGSDTNEDGALANWAGKSNPFATGPYPWTTPVGFYNGSLQSKSAYNWPGTNQTYQSRSNANGFGLYDMSGNVWEWVNDWFGKDYYQYCVANNVVTNPPGPVVGDLMPDGRAYRGLRGGNWFNGQDQYGHGRVSNRDPSYYRGPGDPNGPWFHVGFRVMRRTGTSTTSVVETGASLTQLTSGLHFTEGPAADAAGNVFFSDILANTIYRWSVSNQLSVFRTGSGGANGLAFDKSGNLLACEGDNGRLVSISPQGAVTVLASNYAGLRFNEPNDLWIDPAGGVYFTDPVYFGHETVQGGEYVYYLTPDRSGVVRVVSDSVRPNGVVGTPDGKTLYLADWGASKVFRYSIGSGGALTNKALFAQVACDGMTLDAEGNLYFCEKAVLVYDASGKQIEQISVSERPTNVEFGGVDRKTLFITTEAGSLLSIRMRVQGPMTGSVTNQAPVIKSSQINPAAPTASDVVWVTANVTGSATNVALSYFTGVGSSSGGGPGQTNVVFLETMRASAVKPWTGDGCSNAWAVTFTGNNPFEQRDGANYGTGNTNGMEFKGGTTNLLDSMVAPTQALDTRGASGFVEFWLWADGLSGSAGWAFQVDSGNAYQTRLSELTGQSHNWQLYHYDLQTSELISGLKLRWQFRGGQDSVRMDLDQITVKVVATGGGNESTTVAMLDDGAHQDGAAGDGVYGAAISAQPAGTTVSYYLTAIGAGGLTSMDPTNAPAGTYTFIVKAGDSNPPVTTQTVGLFLNTTNAWPGYTLLAPMHYTNTYLINTLIRRERAS